jgi:hypothetical protein
MMISFFDKIEKGPKGVAAPARLKKQRLKNKD